MRRGRAHFNVLVHPIVHPPQQVLCHVLLLVGSRTALELQIRNCIWGTFAVLDHGSDYTSRILQLSCTENRL